MERKVGFWHKADLRLAAPQGLPTGALPTFGVSSSVIVAPLWRERHFCALRRDLKAASWNGENRAHGQDKNRSSLPLAHFVASY